MIDYKLLDTSTKFYDVRGYFRIEAPWTVSSKVDDITRPESAIKYQLKHNDKCLVASGEQSFLYLYLKNFLPLGKFQTITPCFRYESFDFLHSKYFMKNELIITDKVNESSLDSVVDSAYNFFVSYFDAKNKLEIIKTDIGYDIEIEGKELGSYGIRSCEFLDWVYGTGCAEPRMSNLIKLYGISQD